MIKGDLVRSRWDIKKGIEGPLGIVVDIEGWKRGKNVYTTVHVFLFKSKRVDTFNKNQLEVMGGYKNRR
jgi:hypothetical protein